MPPADPLERALGRRALAVHDRECRIDGADETPKRRSAKVRVLIHTRRDERMRDLHQQCGGAAEKEKAFAVNAASDAVCREDPSVAHAPLVAAVIVSGREVERRRVDAVTHSGRIRTVRKEMAEMGAAMAARDLGALHPE